MGIIAASEVCVAIDNQLDGNVDKRKTLWKCLQHGYQTQRRRCVVRSCPRGFQETCDGIDNDGDAVLNEGACSGCETRSCLFSSSVCVAGANHSKWMKASKIALMKTQTRRWSSQVKVPKPSTAIKIMIVMVRSMTPPAW